MTDDSAPGGDDSVREKPRWSRVLLKLSGEAFAGEAGYGIDGEVVAQIAKGVLELKQRYDIDVAVVVGGGNIWRGMTGAGSGMDRAQADYMGMLATVINALALATSLRKLDIDTVVLSAIAMPEICESFSQRATLYHLSLGRVVIFAGGTGNPFFTTDSAAALRAAEMGAEAIFKGTQVDGIYSADPKKDPTATRFDRLTHGEVLEKGLAVMDVAAVALARENHIPIIVFSIHEKGGFAEILTGGGRGTIVTDN